MHNIRGLSAPVSNSNIANLYGEVLLEVKDVETYMSPIQGTRPELPSDTGELVAIVSTDAGDTGACQLSGLGVDFKVLKEVVVLNGTTSVNTVNSFTRVNNISWLEKTAFLGDLEVTNTAGTLTYRSASPEAQRSLDCLYSVPADRSLVVDTVYAAITRDSTAAAASVVSFYYRPIGFAFRRTFKFAMSNRASSNIVYNNTRPSSLTGPIDLYLAVETTDATSATPTEVVARLGMGMVPKG